MKKLITLIALLAGLFGGAQVATAETQFANVSGDEPMLNTLELPLDNLATLQVYYYLDSEPDNVFKAEYPIATALLPFVSVPKA